jgi:hypothetical protein
MVGARGFEPPTPSLPDGSERLKYLRFFGNHRNLPRLNSQWFSFRLQTGNRPLRAFYLPLDGLKIPSTRSSKTCRRMAGVVGLPAFNDFSGCDRISSSKEPAKSLINPHHCRTFRPKSLCERRARHSLPESVLIRSGAGSARPIGWSARPGMRSCGPPARRCRHRATRERSRPSVRRSVIASTTWRPSATVATGSPRPTARPEAAAGDAGHLYREPCPQMRSEPILGPWLASVRCA